MLQSKTEDSFREKGLNKRIDLIRHVENLSSKSLVQSDIKVLRAAL